ncbi:hypothetical protein BJX64DRAFT_283954 [Aspergillus heterothallicus]
MTRRDEFYYDVSDNFPAYEDCKFPNYPRRPRSLRGHYAICAAIWLCLIALSAFYITSVVIAILAITTDNYRSIPDSPDYDLYKNTRFEDCSNTPPQPYYNCTSVYLDSINLDQSVFKPFQDHGIGVLAQSEYIPVVSSKPRESAYWQPTINEWTSAAGTLLVAVWHTRTVYKASGGKGPECGGLAWDDWLDSEGAPRPSFLGWISPWKYSDFLAYHPFVCGMPSFKKRPKAMRAVRWTLRIIAAAQWVVGAHLFSSVHAADSGRPVYDCLASQILDAPGITSYTAQQICSKDWLFYSPRFIWQVGGGMAVDGLLATFLTCTFVAIIPPLLIPACMLGSLIFSAESKGFKYWRDKYIHYYPGAPVAAAVGPICVIVMAALSMRNVRTGFQRERDGAITFFWGCTALHVNVSPWKNYLDVDDSWLPARFAKVFFDT